MKHGMPKGGYSHKPKSVKQSGKGGTSKPASAAGGTRKPRKRM